MEIFWKRWLIIISFQKWISGNQRKDRKTPKHPISGDIPELE
jgi:hypothetical protein